MMATDDETGFEPVSAAQIKDETREQVLERMRERFGITEPISGKTFKVRLDQLVVDDEEEIAKTSRSMAAAFELVEMMHTPAIVPADEPGKYRVIAGKRRVLGMRKNHASDTIIDVRLYGDLDELKLALMALVENNSRADAWRRDLRELCKVVNAGVAATERDIATLLNVAPSTAHELLLMARLPETVLLRIYAGEGTQKLARGVARMERGQQDKIAEALVDDTTKLTKELVDDALRSSIARQFAAFTADEGDSTDEDEQSAEKPGASRIASQRVTGASAVDELDHVSWLRELAVNSPSARVRTAASIILGEIS